MMTVSMRLKRHFNFARTLHDLFVLGVLEARGNHNYRSEYTLFFSNASFKLVLHPFIGLNSAPQVVYFFFSEQIGEIGLSA
jgi:hypothetical protein